MRRWIATAIALAGCSEYDVTQATFDDWFVQEDTQVVSDVLFVIDDSPSMAEEQERLSENFQAFLDAVTGSKADFQVGVTTTDVESPEAGLLRGGIYRVDTVELRRALQGALLVGTDGDRQEQGLAAAAAALDGRNPGFPRPGAMLSVVFVSDEDDESPGAVDPYVDVLVAHAGEAAHGFHGIVGDLPAGCATGTSAATAGPRYIEAIEATSGRRESICADDYSTLLERVGLDVAGLPDTFALSKVPGPDTIQVFVDEVEIPARELDGYTYDPGPNAIVFHGRAIPRPGMTIGVSYTPLVTQ